LLWRKKKPLIPRLRCLGCLSGIPRPPLQDGQREQLGVSSQSTSHESCNLFAPISKEETLREVSTPSESGELLTQKRIGKSRYYTGRHPRTDMERRKRAIKVLYRRDFEGGFMCGSAHLTRDSFSSRHLRLVHRLFITHPSRRITPHPSSHALLRRPEGPENHSIGCAPGPLKMYFARPPVYNGTQRADRTKTNVEEPRGQIDNGWPKSLLISRAKCFPTAR